MAGGRVAGGHQIRMQVEGWFGDPGGGHAEPIIFCYNLWVKILYPSISLVVPSSDSNYIDLLQFPLDGINDTIARYPYPINIIGACDLFQVVFFERKGGDFQMKKGLFYSDNQLLLDILQSLFRFPAQEDLEEQGLNPLKWRPRALFSRHFPSAF